MTITIYKLGGSLLEMPDLRTRLAKVLSERPESQPLFIVGGGEAANLVRRWDTVHRLGNDAAHSLAIDAMALNERLLTAIWLDATIIQTRDDATTACRDKRIPIINAASFLRDEESQADSAEILRRSWDVTSDSIAAWIATRWPANELVLLKSCDRPSNRHDEITADPVDVKFSKIAATIPQLGWVNLRDDTTKIHAWKPADNVS